MIVVATKIAMVTAYVALTDAKVFAENQKTCLAMPMAALINPVKCFRHRLARYFDL